MASQDLSESSHRPIIFLHIPKTAGTTIRHLLSLGFGRDEVLDLDLTRPREVELWQTLSGETLRRYRLIAGHFRYDFIVAKVPQGRIFTFLRDPIERCLSLFPFLKERAARGMLATPERNELMRGISFEEFVFSDHELVQQQRDNPHIRFLGGLPCPPERSPEEMLALAKQRLAAMDFFGIVEQMPESISMLCAFLGLRPHSEIFSINRGRRRRIREEVDAKLLNRLEETNRYDMELYEYAQDLFQKRWDNWLAEVARQSWDSWLAGVLHQRWRGNLERSDQSLPARIHISFQESVPGWGWYAWDPRGDGTWFRWSGPEAELEVRIDTTRPLRLRCEAANLLQPDALTQLRISANGHPLHLVIHKVGESPWGLLEAPIPKEALAGAAGVLRLTFETARPSRPSEVWPDSEDDRLLGVAVSWLELTPE